MDNNQLIQASLNNILNNLPSLTQALSTSNLPAVLAALSIINPQASILLNCLGELDYVNGLDVLRTFLNGLEVLWQAANHGNRNIIFNGNYLVLARELLDIAGVLQVVYGIPIPYVGYNPDDGINMVIMNRWLTVIIIPMVFLCAGYIGYNI